MQPQILIAYDFGPASEKALRWAIELQRGLGALPLHVVHVLNPVPLVGAESVLPALSEDDIAEVREELKRAVHEHGAPAITEVVVAQLTGEAILETAGRLQADLIVMGTHGRGGLRRIALGSVAEYVVRHASCPVVTVRAEPAHEQPARAA